MFQVQNGAHIEILNGRQDMFLCSKRELNDFKIVSKVLIVNNNQFKMGLWLLVELFLYLNYFVNMLTIQNGHVWKFKMAAQILSKIGLSRYLTYRVN